MNCHGQIEQRVGEVYSQKGSFFRRLVSIMFHDQPEVYHSFLNILTEYLRDRIDHRDVFHQVSRLFCAHPEMIELFAKCFRRANSTKRVNEHDSMETLRSAKKTKTEDDNSKEKSAFRPTSHASISYASDFSRSPCFSGSYPLESEAVASCSSSLPSRPGNSAEAYEAQNKKSTGFRDTILYVTEKKPKSLNERQAYQHLIKLVKDIDSNSVDTYATMKLASTLLEGYPEMIESFNLFLPDGYRIVILSDYHEMRID